MTKSKWKLTSTQIGALAENLIANELMIESGGRLSPFQAIADDNGIDLLIHDKQTGKTIPLQIKSRTSTLKKNGGTTSTNTVHFEVRKSAVNLNSDACLLCILLSSDLRSTERAWLIPMSELPKIASTTSSKYFIRPSRSLSSNDKFKEHQCKDMITVINKFVEIFETVHEEYTDNNLGWHIKIERTHRFVSYVYTEIETDETIKGSSIIVK